MNITIEKYQKMLKIEGNIMYPNTTLTEETKKDIVYIPQPTIGSRSEPYRITKENLKKDCIEWGWNTPYFDNYKQCDDFCLVSFKRKNNLD